MPADVAKKRQLLSLVFQEMTLDEGKLEYAYTEPFRLLSEAVFATNSSKLMKTALSQGDIFEPEEFLDIKVLTGGKTDQHPDWLASSPDILFQIFSVEKLAQIEEQLKDLERILKMKANYKVIKVKNGELLKL